MVERNPDGSVKLFPCEKCGKTYKQRNSLYKHQWEHSEFWEPTARKFNMSKHQQVQVGHLFLYFLPSALHSLPFHMLPHLCFNVAFRFSAFSLR